MELKCKRCGREWEYKGTKKYYTSCPDCKTSIKIIEVKGGTYRQDENNKS